MKKITLFSDGSCTLSKNGQGGYGAVLIYGDQTREIYGGCCKTTNNRTELMGVIFGLKALVEPCDVTIYSDSKYVVDPINKKWVVKWFAKDFKNIKNEDLWRELIKEMSRHKTNFNWVKGHNKGVCPGNERADELAAMGASLIPLQVDCRSPKLFDILKYKVA